MLLEKIQKENDIKQLKPRASGIESRCGGAYDGAASGV